MNGHLRRCRLRSGPHVRNSTLRSGCSGRAARARGNIRRADHVGPVRLASDHCFATCKEPARLALAPLARAGS